MIAAARAATAAFFVLVAAYCFLAASPFAYEQFIKPSVLPELADFVRLSPILFWLMTLVTLLTLMPYLSGDRRSRAAQLFMAAAGLAAVALTILRPLEGIGAGRRALALGVAALVPPVALTFVDLRTRRFPPIASSDVDRIQIACVLSALVVWASYALAVPLRLRDAVGVDLSGGAMAASLTAAAAADLTLFTILFLVLTIIARLGAAFRSAAAEYWLLIATFAIAVTLTLYFLVCTALSFRGAAAWTASAALGVALAAAAADLGLVRVRAADRDEPVEALTFFLAAIAGSRSRVAALATLCAVPFGAYWLAAAVRRLDWDFLLQKLGVIVVFSVTLAACHAIVSRRSRPRSDLSRALIPALVFALTMSVDAVSSEHVRAGYEAVDPSFRLLRDARRARSSETSSYYAYLRARTLVPSDRIQPIDGDFVSPLVPRAARLPNVFLIVVDSLRRDYVSAYNPRVTFTPNLAALAAESDVFDRAFTRYAGTYLSVQSIWAGGLPFHAADQPAFDRRDTLRKLLVANDYVMMMTRDNVVSEFVPADERVVTIGAGRKQMEIQSCPALGELESALAARDPNRPVFFWSLPQDVHLGVMTHVNVPTGEAYPGFFDKVAHQATQLDACIGRFVAFLKRAELYDNSIVIVTADHGDLYGDEGRWGHANLLYPDVVRVPLIVRVPPRLRENLQADLNEAAFLTDLTPSLYRLLGYEPADLGTLFGRPLYASRDATLPTRRADGVLVASAYGAVYGVLRQSGRRLYVVDTIEGREYLADMGGATPRIVDLSPAATAVHRALIRRDIGLLSDLYHYQP